MDIKMLKVGAAFALTVGLGAAFTACSNDEVLSPTDAGADATSDVAETSTDAGAETTTDTGTSSDSTPADAADANANDAADASDAADAASSDAGSVADCLSSTTDFTGIFTLQDASKCLVAQYSVAATGLAGLTWGRHGGPLGLDSSNATTPAIVRYQVPSTTTGTVTIAKQSLMIPSLPSTLFWAGQAVDLPFFGWTALGYTGNGTGYPGELILADASSNLTRYDVNGLFSMSAIGLSGGRLVYSGLSTIGTTTSTGNTNGLYAADQCGTASSSPRLVPNGDATCTAPQMIAAWGEASGPVTKDASENVFAFESFFSTGKQELRGFENTTIAHGAAATAGDSLATMDGYGSELAADGKALYFQPYDGTSYKALDIVSIGYTVNASTHKISATAPVAFLKLVTPGTAASLVTDNFGRLWVIVPKAGASPTESWIFVLRNKNP